MKFSNRHFQNQLSSSQGRLKDIKTETDWVYNADGGFVSPSGYGACMTVDYERGLVKAWTSKNKNFDVLDNGDGQRVLSQKTAQRGYLTSVSSINNENSVDLLELTAGLKKFNKELSERAGHYLFFGVTFADNPLEFNNSDSVLYGKGQRALFNAKGASAYLHDLQNNTVDRVQSIYRKGGHFKPIQFSNNIIAHGFSARKRRIFEGGSVHGASVAMDQSRRQVCQNIWEQKNVTEDLPDQSSLHLSKIYNGLHSMGAVKIASTVPVGMYFAAYQPHFTIGAVLGGVVLAAHHEQVAEFFEHGVDSSRKMSARFAQKVGLSKFSQGVYEESLYESQLKGGNNLIFGRDNVYKFGSKASEAACVPEGNEMLPDRYVKKAAKLLLAKKIDGEQHDMLEEFLAKIHQLNISGVVVEPDKHVLGFAYDNGVRAVRYDDPKTGDIVIAAQFDDNIIDNDDLGLPRRYREQFLGQYIVFDCYVDEGRFKVDAINDGYSRQDVLDIVNDDLLFKHQSYMPDEIKEQSYMSMEKLFPYENENPYEDRYLSDDVGKFVKLDAVTVYPFAEARMGKAELEDLGYPLSNEGMDTQPEIPEVV